MDDKIKLFLLKGIEKHKEISCLEQVGYSYSDIVACLSDLINDGYIDVDEATNYILSDLGYEMMNELEDSFRKKGIVLVEPFAKYRIDKISKYDIFIE